MTNRNHRKTPRRAVTGRITVLIVGSCCGAVLVLAGLGYWVSGSNSTKAHTETGRAAITTVPVVHLGPDELQLTQEQLAELSVGPVVTLAFEQRRDAIGIIDFNQDMAVQVFSPYQGRIGRMLVKAGDDVAPGQVLYTVQIPDLAAAASTLISSAGTLKVANETLHRAQGLAESQSIAQKELQQNTADQQSADAAYRAARKTLALFGLTERDISEIESTRKVDTEMPVRSPFAGRVTARAGAPGLLVQPGAGSAPIAVANMQTLWMVASVPESEIAAYHQGQAVQVTVQAYPDTRFAGKISYVGDSSDAITHRVAVRAEVRDAMHRLKPQMLASFSITLGPAVSSPAVPANALVREGDGTTSAWLQEGELRFKRRKVQTGLTQNGLVQIVSGLNAGDRVARDKALFLSNLSQISIN